MKFLRAFLVLALLAATLAIPAGASAQDEGGGDTADGPTILGLGDDGGGATEIPVLEPSVSEPWLSDVLPETTAGPEALEALTDDVLAQVAAQVDLDLGQLTDVLSSPDAFVRDNGDVFFQDPVAPVNPDGGGAAASEPGPFPNAETFLLHSKPGSSKTIYLDFDGYDLPAGTVWRGGNTYSALAFDLDGNYGTFNQAEHDTIQSIFLRVSEDYAPFDVDVTTQDPGYAAINRASAADDVYGMRVVITDSPNFDFCGASGCGGVAATLGHFDYIGNEHDIRQPVWTFQDGAGDGAKGLAETTTHEVGHSVGLSHDGQTGPPHVEYYPGHNMWSTSMGSYYTVPVVQWSKGEYTDANNTEDDFPIIVSNGPQLIPDTEGGGLTNAIPLVPGQTHLVGKSPAFDPDTFKYTPACSGSFTFDFTPASVSPNLNIVAQIYEGTTFLEQVANPVVKSTFDLATGMDASITRSLTGGTEYILGVLPGAQGTPQDGFSTYGSIGRYSIDVTPPGGCGCASNDAYSGAISLGTVGQMKSTVTGDNTCATNETGETLVTGAAGQTLWYSFVAEATGSATVSTCSATTVIDSTLGVYSNGANVGAASLLKSNDDLVADDGDRCSFGSLRAQLTLPVTAGTTYRVQVDHFLAPAGIFELSVQQHFCGSSTFGAAATQVGSDGNDVWTNLPNGAKVVGLAGNDAMSAASTTTGLWLCGGADADDLRGTANYDIILGGDGNDDIRGFGAGDFLAGDCEDVIGCDLEAAGDGNDTIRGGGGDDGIWAGGGIDNVIAGAGVDSINGGTGDDSLNGGADADTIYGGDDDDVVRGQGDVDTQWGGLGDDVMRGHAGNDIMRGEGGNDTLLAASGDDTLYGGPDDDTLWAGTGADFVNGGTGTDFCHGGTDTDVDTHTECETTNKFP